MSPLPARAALLCPSKRGQSLAGQSLQLPPLGHPLLTFFLAPAPTHVPVPPWHLQAWLNSPRGGRMSSFSCPGGAFSVCLTLIPCPFPSQVCWGIGKDREITVYLQTMGWSCLWWHKHIPVFLPKLHRDWEDQEYPVPPSLLHESLPSRSRGHAPPGAAGWGYLSHRCSHAWAPPQPFTVSLLPKAA